MAVNRHLLTCQLKIGGLDEFSPFVEYLEELREKYMSSLVSIKDIDVLRQLQGRVQQLDEILEGLAEAPALASKTNGV